MSDQRTFDVSPGRPGINSATVQGSSVAILVAAAQQLGWIPAGLLEQVALLVQAAGAIWGIFGLRRALK